MIEKIGPTVYKGGTIYNIGGGGGGGGGGLPDGYKQCYYFVFKQNTTLYQAPAGDYIFKDIVQTDNIKIVGSLAGGTNSYNYGITTNFKINNTSTKFNIIYNKTDNIIRLQSFWEYLDVPYSPSIVYGRIGALNDIFIDSSVKSNDNHNTNVVGITNLFQIELGGDYVGSKFSLFQITDKDGNIKHKLIPAVNTNNNTKVVIDVITGFEITLDTSKIDCGPVID